MKNLVLILVLINTIFSLLFASDRKVQNVSAQSGISIRSASGGGTVSEWGGGTGGEK